MRFTIPALTKGTGAQGKVTVRFKENGIMAPGNGAGRDIVTADRETTY